MKGLNYRPPCDAHGDFADWLNALRNLSGVYVIRSCAGLFSAPQCLYVGRSHSGRLAKTIKRHFYRWDDDGERVHQVYDRRDVEIAVRLTPPNAAPGAEANLIRRLEPRDNGLIPADRKPF